MSKRTIAVSGYVKKSGIAKIRNSCHSAAEKSSARSTFARNVLEWLPTCSLIDRLVTESGLGLGQS